MMVATRHARINFTSQSETNPRRGATLNKVLLGILLIVGGIALAGFGAWRTGLTEVIGYPSSSQKDPRPMVEIDQGLISAYFVEPGEFESANNATVYCEVEAILGAVGGGSSGFTPSRSSSSSSAGGGGTTQATGGGGAAAGGAGGAGTAATGGSGGSVLRPQDIQSFSYRVTPHVPIRGSSGGGSISTSRSRQSGGGGRGGDNGSGRYGSTTIIWLIEEGSPVETGQLVCELDSSAFEDELQLQKIRTAQAKSWLIQAQTILDVANIEYREYKDGIYPQDIENLKQSIELQRLQERQAGETLAWSQEMKQKGLRSAAQVLGDELFHEQQEILLNNVIEMEKRLRKYTGPRILTSLEAKIASVRSDVLTQEEAYKIEEQRQQRLERAIANCKLYAPDDGIAVYAQEVNGWGRVEDQIMEGTTVREGQAIINIPDPTKMQVRVNINETRFSSIQVGQQAEVRVDAFPDQPLRGQLVKLKPIPAPPYIVSDVRLYTGIVSVDGGFEGLRTGLSAEVAFHIGDVPDAIRIPIGSIRWVGRSAFAAVPQGPNDFEWRPLKLGLLNWQFAEVQEGLSEGDRVLANPLSLPTPTPILPDANSNERVENTTIARLSD